MKKFFKIAAFTPLLFVLFLLILLSIQYSPTYVYRLITMHVADVHDYKNFENRIIQGAESAYSFEVNHDESYVESLFGKTVKRSGFNSFEEWAETSQTTALIFIRKDTILYEKYFNGFSRDSYFHSQSMAKSFISFLIGAAIDDGLIQSIKDPMTKYIPELKDRDPRFANITIKHLLEMRSGLSYHKSYFPGTHIHSPWHDEAVGYYHDNVRRRLLKEITIDRDPDLDYEYNNYNTSYLGLIIERATQKTVSVYLEEKLWSKIMEYDALFSIDSKKSGFEYMPSRLIARAIDYAKFGRLFLQQGDWNGKQIISQDWVVNSIQEDQSIDRADYPKWFGDKCNHTYYAYQWWGHTTCDSSYHFFASGNLGQNIYVIPQQEIIIVHCGNSNEYYNDADLRRVANEIR